MVFEKKPHIRLEAFTSELARGMNENTRRIRVLEQNLEAVRSRISGLEEKVIDEMNNLKKWLDQISADVKLISESLRKIRSELLRINKELEKAARKTEVKELESLLELYNPIKSHFVTIEQVRKIVDEEMRKKY